MPCSVGMRRCHRNCLHRQMVEDYRWSRLRWEEQREDEQHMRLEEEEYREQYPPPTFKAWLQGNRRKF